MRCRATNASRRSGHAKRFASHRLGGFRWAELEDRLLLAELTQEMKLAGESAVHLRAASQLAVSLDADVATARVALTAAGIALASGQPGRTLQVLDNARDSLGLLGAGATAEAMALRARAYGRARSTRCGNRRRRAGDRGRRANPRQLSVR
jgi:hypothetical protein